MILSQNSIWDFIPTDLFYSMIIQCFLSVIVGCICFILFMTQNKYFRGGFVKYFYFAVVTIILLSFADMGEAYFRLLPEPTLYRRICGGLGYILRPMVLFFQLKIFFYFDKKKRNLMLMIPLIINILIVLSSFFLKYTDPIFMYDYDATNTIHRGILVGAPFILTIYYFAILIIFGINKLKFGYSKELYISSFIFLVMILTTVLEVSFEYKGLIPTCALFGVSYYYMYYLSYTYSVDYLTGCFVGFKLFEDVKRLKTNYTIIEFDINGLKKINDALGHLAGDKMIIDIINIINSVSPRNIKMYRIGGDEFVIIYKTQNIEKIMSYINKIHNSLEESNCSVSIGYSIKDENETFEEGMLNADRMMYTEKDFYHSEINKNITQE